MKASFENRTETNTGFSDEHLKNLHDCILLIRETGVPFVAAVNGVCAGAGTNFALACDIVFASENATFNEGFVKIGLTPDCGGSYFLPRLIGEKLAAEFLMTGDAITSQRAFETGMINRVVANEDLITEATKFAARLAKMSTSGIGRIKKMLAATATNDLRAQLDLEHKLQIESGNSKDFTEGVTAFFEKRSPDFKGE
ncbi:MAG: enoyl-CoA hydratase/isomerase family protein [Pyrinomonadaceae bacterium]|nr:enoyl-CoA hydratase/isomerase family protein [Pyrinomonadaceae bacterium]